MIEEVPQSALRSGRFASRPTDAREEPFVSTGYNLQPLLELAPFNLFVDDQSPSKSRKVAFPGQSQETAIHYHPISPVNDTPKKERKNTKIATKGYGRSGIIQSRTGATPLVLQRWTRSCWLHVYPATLNVFESEEKMNQWKAMDSVSYDGLKKVKDKLVLASINFDTEGKLQRKINLFQGRKVSNDTRPFTAGEIRDGYSTEKMFAYETAKKGIPAKYIMEEVRSKYYSKSGPLMHTCKISYRTHVGRNIEAAFGSIHAEELKNLRSVVRYCIRLVRKSSKTKRRKPRYSDGASIFSGMTRGPMSAISGTEYGEATMTKHAAKRMGRRNTRSLLV